jgi:allophanate hydrolase subunit 2
MSIRSGVLWQVPSLALVASTDPVGLAGALRSDPGVEDAVPGHGSVLVRGLLPAELPAPRPPAPAREHAIAVRYDGKDLATFGLPAADVVRLHSDATYTVDLLGFAPGFAYLRGLDPALQRPRRSTPRPRVPELSVACAEDLTAIYPGGSAGGWHLLGRAVGITLFAEGRALLAPGDVVRFFPVDREDPVRRAEPPRSPLVRIVQPGFNDLLVDGGTVGQQHLGVPRGGALDPAALDRANALVGNAPGTPGLECVLRGPVLESLRILQVAVVGAGFTRRLQGRRVEVGTADPGLRCWVAVRGGVRDLGPDGFDLTDLAAHADHETASTPSPGPLVLLPGPQPQAWESLLDRDFSVAQHSDRVGLRLEGRPVPDAGPAVVQGIAPGMVQVTPDGRAVVFLAGCPATGGYPVAGWVPWECQAQFAQLRPGQTLRFSAPA